MIKNHRPIDKLIAIGDPHFGFMSNSKEWLDNMLVFFYEQLIPYIDALPDISKYSIIIMGDTYDKKQIIDTLIQNMSLDVMEELSKRCPVYIILGNHDTPREKERHINNCKALGYMNNVHLMVMPETLTTIKGESILMLPWMHKTVDFDPERAAIEAANNHSYCFAHTEVVGFHYENKSVDNPQSLTMEDLSKFKMFWSGHIHKRQYKGNVGFLGAPYHTRTVEHKNDAGFTIIDFDISDMAHTPAEKYIHNTVSPRHVKMPINQLLESDVAKLEKEFENNYVKIRVTSDDLRTYDVTKIFSMVPTVYKNIDYELVHNFSIDEGISIDDGDYDDTLHEIGEQLKDIDMISMIEEYVFTLDVISITQKEQIDTNPLKDDMLVALNKYHSHSSNNK